MIEGFIMGAITGALYGITGYVKNKQDFVTEEFDFDEFLPTVLGTAVIGMIAFAMSNQIDLVASSAIGLVVTQVIRKLWKGKVWKLITDKFN